MMPDAVGSGTPEVYSKRSPGASTGCSPTTPSPRTSCLRPVPSVMIQCRVLSCTVSAPELVMTMVYDQKYCCRSGDERSGRKFGSTVTSIWRVTARYMQTLFHTVGMTIIAKTVRGTNVLHCGASTGNRGFNTIRG